MITEINTAVAPSGRIDALGWDNLASELNDLGCALTDAILIPTECADIAALYGDDDLFRASSGLRRSTVHARDHAARARPAAMCVNSPFRRG
jgi:hypothetical protein